MFYNVSIEPPPVIFNVEESLIVAFVPERVPGEIIPVNLLSIDQLQLSLSAFSASP